jgi:hypothetical protein
MPKHCKKRIDCWTASLPASAARWADGSRKQQEAIEAVSRFETWGRSRGIRSVGAQIKGVLTKHAAAAVVVVAVGLYFAITFSWVTQITALIRYGL